MMKVKFLCFPALFSLCILTRGFSEAIITAEAGYQNYISIDNGTAGTEPEVEDGNSAADTEGSDGPDSKMIHGISAGVSASAVFAGHFITGLFVEGIFALTEPGYILCKPGFEIGGLITHGSLFQTFTANIAPVFHNENYISPDIDIALGAKFRNYLQTGNRNLYFVFTFGMDYFFNEGNMAYTITVGLGRKAFFSSRNNLSLPETAGIEKQSAKKEEPVLPGPASRTSAAALTPPVSASVPPAASGAQNTPTPVRPADNSNIPQIMPARSPGYTPAMPSPSQTSPSPPARTPQVNPNPQGGNGLPYSSVVR